MLVSLTDRKKLSEFTSSVFLNLLVGIIQQLGDFRETGNLIHKTSVML